MYPVVQTVQRDGICREVIAPAPGLAPGRAAQAAELALRIAAELGVTGLLAVEMFETPAGLLVNELAMRPHNCGHWTIEGARTSQFEQHLRAVLDLPLGSPAMAAPVAVMANVLGGDDADVYDRYIHVMAADPAIKVHMYGKPVRPGRKIGHVTVTGDAGSHRSAGTGGPGPPRRQLPPLGQRGRGLTRDGNHPGRDRDGQRFGLAGDARRGRGPGRVRRPL